MILKSCATDVKLGLGSISEAQPLSLPSECDTRRTLDLETLLSNAIVWAEASLLSTVTIKNRSQLRNWATKVGKLKCFLEDR